MSKKVNFFKGLVVVSFDQCLGAMRLSGSAKLYYLLQSVPLPKESMAKLLERVTKPIFKCIIKIIVFTFKR